MRKMSKIQNITKNQCIICTDSITDNESILLHKTRRQTHALCIDCGIQYISTYLKQFKSLIKRGLYKKNWCVVCPGTYHGLTRNKCECKIPLVFLKLPRVLIKDVAIVTFHSVLRNSFRLCPYTDCDNVIVVDEDNDTSRIVCSLCKRTSCRLCNNCPYHDDKQCSDTIDLYVNNKILANDIKRCPNCNIPVEKVRNEKTGSFVSCNKIRCVSCDITWCWLCEKLNIDYSHYNPANKQGCPNSLWKGVDLKMYE